MNYKRHLESLRDNRNAWLAMLNANPDNTNAASQVFKLNSQIEYISTLKLLDGDYS